MRTLGALEGSLENGGEVTALEHVPALLVRMLVERIQVAAQGSGEQGDVLTDDCLQWRSCISRCDAV